MFQSLTHVLIVEPNEELLWPYSHLSQILPTQSSVHRVTTITEATMHLRTRSIELVFLSTAFTPWQSLHFLEELKANFTHSVIPLIFVVDWSKRLHRILGTHWGNKISILHSLSSQEEVAFSLQRII